MPSERRPAWAGLAAAALLCSVPVEPQPRLADRILAVVAERPLLLSEVRLVERLRGLEPGAALEAAIDERLMFEQASRLPQTAPSGEEQARALDALRERLGDPAPDVAALEEMARRQTTILKYIDFRFRPLLRAEQATRDDADPELDPAESLEARLNARIEAWIAELRAEATIRYNPGEPEAGS